MPRIVVPIPWTEQPQQVPRLSRKWASRISFAWTATETLSTVIGPEGITLNGAVTGAAPTGTTHTVKGIGRVVNFHPAGGADGVGGVNTKKSSDQNVTVFWFGYSQTTSTSFLQTLNRGLNADSFRINPLVGISYIDSSPAQFDANYSPAKTIVPDQYEAIAGRKSGSTIKAFDWRTRATVETTGGNGTFRSDGAGDYFYVNHKDTGPNGHVHCPLTFAVNGHLSDQEVWDLLDNPWQIFEDEEFPVWFTAAATGLSGAAASTATATGAITQSVPLAGASVSTATASGAIAVSIPLDAAASVTSNASGGLTLAVPLAASAVAQALASAGITQGVPLQGGAAAAAAAPGALSINVSLAGAAIAEAAASAGLTVVTSGLQGDATASAAASATLTHGVPLSGAALSVSESTGNVTQIVPLSGAAASASLATGGLDLSVSLSAVVLSQALAAAGLTIGTGLQGAAPTNADAIGAITLRVNLDGAAVAQAIALGALVGTGGIIPFHKYMSVAQFRDYRFTADKRYYGVLA